MTHNWMAIVTGVAVSALVVTGIWSPAAAAETTSSQASLGGTGTWRSQQYSTHGSWTADLVRTGDDVGGTFRIVGSALSGGKVNGMMTDGNTITFGVIEDTMGDGSPPVATFTGTIDGSRVAGTYKVGGSDSGEWEGSLTAK